MHSPSTQLLVSVRSAREAEIALEGGAGLIDIKEPERGPLGRADADVIREVIRAVASRCPVSAALGEWAQGVRDFSDRNLTYIKWGLAGCGRHGAWRHELSALLEKRQKPQIVLVAYADWQNADAPAVDDVFGLAAAHSGGILLVDSHGKEPGEASEARPTLLDWLTVAQVEELCDRARQSRVRIALAGSLGMAEIRALRQARPDWFAVRGAVCDEGDRNAGVQSDRVRALVDLLKPTAVR